MQSHRRRIRLWFSLGVQSMGIIVFAWLFYRFAVQHHAAIGFAFLLPIPVNIGIAILRLKQLPQA